MRYPVFVTLLWVFSFSLLGECLAGQVDGYFAVLTRMVIAGLVFLPLTRWHDVAPAFLLFGNPCRLPKNALRWGVQAWLGPAASGLGHCWWNKGASPVDAGTLAVMNNALVPAGLLVNLLLWIRDADQRRLVLGGTMITASSWLARSGATLQALRVVR